MLTRYYWLIGFAAVFGFAHPVDTNQVRAAANDQRPGKTIADFTLVEPATGKSYSLSKLAANHQTIVFVFMGTVCPVNNQYMPRLNQITETYKSKGVIVLGINSNYADSAEAIAQHAKEWKLTFPVLRDENNRVSDQFGARLTPEAFVLDAKRQVRYHGRIDNQYARLYKKLEPTTHELTDALDALLADKTIAKTSTLVEGCYISRAPKPTSREVTFTKHIAPILQQHCQECHRSGQIAPMALVSYADAAAWAETIREVVETRVMPPWYASPKYGHFANERRVPEEAIKTLAAWVEAGCPEGNPKDLPPAKKYDSLTWQIGNPDLILPMDRPYNVPADTPKGGIPYQYFVLDPGFTEDMWVEKAEARAGEPSVVHHILAFIVPPRDRIDPDLPTFPLLPGVKQAQVLCGTAPGDMPTILPEGTARHIPAGSKIVLQMHYTPNGKAVQDRSSIGLVFAKTKPKHKVQAVPVFNERIRIPPHAAHHREESRYTFKQPGRIISLMPHMHLRGAEFRVNIVHATGKERTALWVPEYNFNWQLVYRLKEPIVMPKGSTMHCIAHYDNSENNPFNPDPARKVYWGDQTWQEMLIGWADVVWDKEIE